MDKSLFKHFKKHIAIILLSAMAASQCAALCYIFYCIRVLGVFTFNETNTALLNFEFGANIIFLIFALYMLLKALYRFYK